MKLDHIYFRETLNTHVCEPDHADVKAAYGFVRGIYFTLQSCGFEEYQVNRVIAEHLMPGYFIERMIPGDIYPRYRIYNPFTDVARARKSKLWEESPFSNESESKIRELYSDLNHSEKFWATYDTEWLPEHQEYVKERNEGGLGLKKWLGPEWICSNPNIFYS